jgi:hypothetical protein
MKKLALLGGVVGLGLGTLLVLHAHAADHLDAPTVQTNPMADITDVYAWMDSSGTKVNLVMDVSPGDPGAGSGSSGPAPRHFGPSILYVFHVTSVDKFPPTAGTETKVICKFDSDTNAQCWVGTAGYVQGDPSNTAGVKSADGKVRLYAGRRSDPFFFNFNGFTDAVAAVDAAEGSAGNLNSLDTDGDGCPDKLNGSAAATIRGLLQEGPTGAAAHAPCNGTDTDCFLHFDVHSIVLQIDKSLLNTSSHTILGVWGSTHAAN